MYFVVMKMSEMDLCPLVDDQFNTRVFGSIGEADKVAQSSVLCQAYPYQIFAWEDE